MYSIIIINILYLDVLHYVYYYPSSNINWNLRLRFFFLQVWFSNRRAKWRREEKLRNQRRGGGGGGAAGGGGGLDQQNGTPAALSSSSASVSPPAGATSNAVGGGGGGHNNRLSSIQAAGFNHMYQSISQPIATMPTDNYG